MFSGTVLARLALPALLCSAPLLGQQKPASPTSPAALEFPVVMQQAVTAGATPVGAKVQAKLAVATLVDGKVLPRNAVFSGEVTESVAKTKTDSSRLAIRMDSVQWKNGSASLHVYLTAWYYPVRADMGQNLAYEPPDAASSPRNWNGAGTYPDPSNPIAQQRFPGADPDKSANSMPDIPNLIASNHRVLMKNVESARSSDGTVAITCKRSNIKLDKMTTYELAPADAPSK
jgi:hypothetical protein